MELSSEFRRTRYPHEITPKGAVPKKVVPKKVVPEEIVKKPRDTKLPQDKRKWIAIESTIAFNFDNLHRKIRNHLKKQYPEITIEELHSKMGESLKSFSINNQIFEYLPVPNTLGGTRWYILCPKCKHRSVKLFLPKEEKDREPLYLCKHCHKLKPISMLLYNNKRYKHITKPMVQLEKIKNKLLKRKKLGTEEVEQLFLEYDKIESTIVNSPEYRLWMFKKEHGKSL